MTCKGRLGLYYRLTKPGIVYSNAMTAAAGYLYGAGRHFHWLPFGATVVGTTLVIAAACAANNVTDRRIDAIMSRTRRRAVPSGSIRPRSALIYAAILGVIGYAVLAAWSRPIVVVIGLIGVIDYILLYGWSKRHSIHSTLIGSVCGAAPLVAGYCAATGRFDVVAALLFAIMVTWQMPHFYAIGIFRRDDYAAAGLPVLPVARGLRRTVREMIVYTVLFAVAALLLFATGHAGYTYVVVMAVLSLLWLRRVLPGFSAPDPVAWARRGFLFSLIVLLGLSAALALNPFVV